MRDQSVEPLKSNQHRTSNVNGGATCHVTQLTLSVRLLSEEIFQRTRFAPQYGAKDERVAAGKP